MTEEPGFRQWDGGLHDPEEGIHIGLHGGVELLAAPRRAGRRCDDMVPALLTRMSRPPSSVCACSTMALQKARFAMSPGRATLFTPAAWSCCRTCTGVRLLFAGQVGDGDVRALSGEGDGDGAADAGVRAGDEGLAALQPAGAGVAGLSVVGRRASCRGARPGWLWCWGLKGGCGYCLRGSCISKRSVRHGVLLRSGMRPRRSAAVRASRVDERATKEGQPKLTLCGRAE